MISIGSIMFAISRNVHLVIMKKESKTDKKIYVESEMWKGYLLLLVSITAEAFFSDSQAYIKIAYKPTINHLMTAVNTVTFVLCLTRLIVGNQIASSIRFCINHPSVNYDIFCIAFLQIFGQFSIYYIVMNFKQHIFPLIATTRKVFTVLLSIYIYNHKMNVYQWVALVIVFSGMIYELSDEFICELKEK